jgi:hypothetical protein
MAAGAATSPRGTSDFLEMVVMMLVLSQDMDRLNTQYESGFP